jgi:hypothetical protein
VDISLKDDVTVIFLLGVSLIYRWYTTQAPLHKWQVNKQRCHKSTPQVVYNLALWQMTDGNTKGKSSMQFEFSIRISCSCILRFFHPPRFRR